jgi:HAD superfamily hydrolase (TIGR01509 family)
MKNMIKAVFIDWGYVFMKGFKSRDRKLNKILKPLGLNWENFIPLWRNFYILRSSGKIKSDKELEIYLKRVIQKEIPVKKIIEITIESHLIPKEHIEVVKKLKKDYKVGILSNNVQGWIDRVLRNYKIENLFDAVIVSSKVGARKPDATIYCQALKKFSVKPKEAVFIADEVAEDLVPATGLGMKTIWLKTDSKGWWKENDEKVLKIYQPNATIKNLKEVIPIIKKWQS